VRGGFRLFLLQAASLADMDRAGLEGGKRGRKRKEKKKEKKKETAIYFFFHHFLFILGAS